MFANV